ncbi:NAD(P)/FAD-dependent oxidoreductase [Sulfurimonas sp.]
MAKKNKIIVIGGGYGGLKAVAALAKHETNHITLIDKNAYHFMQTDVYELIANEKDFAKVSVDLFTYCSGFDENVSFYKQEVLNVDFIHKKVITDTQRFSYDYLIIAVGARTKFVKSINGLKEHAHGVKALHRAMYFKQKFEMSLFKKVQESGVTCKPLSIVVAGAGLSGVEIAVQMASFAKEFYCSNNFLCRKLNIILVSSSQQILKGMDEFLVKKSQKRLFDLEVVIKSQTRVVSLTKESVTLSNGEVIAMDFMIFAGGIEPNGLIYKLDLDKNERGFLTITEALHVKRYKEVFAIGDCATLYNHAKFIAPTADVAEQMGELCSKNIMNLIQHKALQRHNIKSRGILIALGRRYAVGKVAGLHVWGYLAYFIKKAIEKVYFMQLDRHSKKGCHKIFEE